MEGNAPSSRLESVHRRTASAILCENIAAYLLAFASMSHVTVFGHWQTALGELRTTRDA